MTIKSLTSLIILEKKILDKTEFDKVKDMWIPLALTEWGKEKIRAVSFYLSESELRKELKDTTDSKNLMEKLGTPPLQNLEEIKEVLVAAEKGDCLTPYQLERMEKVLVVIRRLKDYLNRGKMYRNPLAYYEENLDAADALKEEIAKQIRGDVVDDYASKEFSQIRKQIMKCEEQMKQKAEQVMRSQRECMADHYCTMRNGRICVPVKKDCKLKISGSVVDKSATGNTLFIEPSGVAKYYEELQLLKIQEENEVYRILYTLTAMVAESAAVMYENIATIEKLDFIFSKGKLSIDMGEDSRGIVITGPNTGGEDGSDQDGHAYLFYGTVRITCYLQRGGHLYEQYLSLRYWRWTGS